jgi:7-dehydrocholesterol reductase
MLDEAASITSETCHRFGEARGGWLRRRALPLLLMVLSPLTVVLLWIAVAHFEGSPLAMLRDPHRVLARWPWPSLRALEMIAAWAALQTVLLRWLPGRTYLGPTTPMGNRPHYKVNGVTAYAVTHLLLWLGAYPLALFSPTLIYDHFGELLATLITVALLLCALLLVKGMRSPSSSDSGVSGNLVWDYFWGVELHPAIAGLSLKQLVNCRIAMMGWSVIILSFAAKHHQLHGTVSPAMAATLTVQLAYIVKFFVWERGYFGSLDITHDRFGFFIVWGILSWLPGVYTLGPFHLVRQPGNLSVVAACMVTVVGVACVLINYQADAQRLRVRETNGKTTVWGSPPELMVARYRTGDGQTHESLLLLSGWWGVARHANYVAELGAAVAWTIPAGLEHSLPWFYPLFLGALLFDRIGRDELRCRGKYGDSWASYCRRVPWRMLPGIY